MERRGAKRFAVVDLDLFNKQTQEHVGKIINISKGGLLVNASNEFPTGEEFDFYIPFTKNVNGEVKFEFNARVVWCQPNPLTPSAFSVGMEFSNIPELQTVFIQKMIQIYGEG
jgi:Tfp pilus assembly protein PilZ